MEQYDLSDRRVAVLATNGYERSELDEPVKALKEAGATVDIVSIKSGTIKGWKSGNWSGEVEVDRTVEDAKVADYDALVLPGGTLNPDTLRTEERAVSFVRGFFSEGKPVAAICHGPQILIEADVVSGRRMTSYQSIRTDLQNAGADWTDEECVCDQGLVTSRTPDDLPAFIDKMLEEISEGVHARQRAG